MRVRVFYCVFFVLPTDGIFGIRYFAGKMCVEKYIRFSFFRDHSLLLRSARRAGREAVKS